MQHEENNNKPDKAVPSAQISPEAEARLAAAAARREQRLAQALRENLKRRKAQIRDRAALPTPQDADLAESRSEGNNSDIIVSSFVI